MINSIDFTKEMMRIDLSPVQEFVLKCVFGEPLSKDKKIEVPDLTNSRIKYTLNEIEFFDFLVDTGKTNLLEYNEQERKQVILAFGRRSGKSFLSRIITYYEQYRLFQHFSPQKHYKLSLDHPIHYGIISINPGMSQINKDLYCESIMCSHSTLKDRIVRNNKDSMSFQTDADVFQLGIDSISTSFSSYPSLKVRGYEYKMLILDDIDSEYDNSTIYTSIEASIGSFLDSKIIFFNTPNREEGEFWEQYNESFNKKDSTLMFNLPSAMLNPIIDNPFLEHFKANNYNGFINEFGSEFISIL